MPTTGPRPFAAGPARRRSAVPAHLRGFGPAPIRDELPSAPYRQWTLSVPWRLRAMLARDRTLLSATLTCFVRAVFRWQRAQARARGIVPLPAPTDDDVAAICARVVRRIQRLLDGDDREDHDDDGASALLADAARSPINPVLTIREQLEDTLEAHRPAGTARKPGRAAELLALVGIAADRLDSYPHQLWGAPWPPWRTSTPRSIRSGEALTRDQYVTCASAPGLADTWDAERLRLECLCLSFQ